MLVKIVQLPEFRAVSFHVPASETPELDAWAQLRAWAEPRGLLTCPTVHQVFGRNNPSPMEQRPMRGYEFLLTIPADYALEPDVAEVVFPGGLYAVVQSRGIPEMIANYERIFGWIQASGAYTPDYPEGYDLDHLPGLELEHHIDPHCEDEHAMLMDVYVPIRPAR